jgi:hypothetical protein
MGLRNETAIAAVIPALVDLRNKIDEAGAPFAASILDIAVLELKTRLHGISAIELGQFANALQTGCAVPIGDEPQHKESVR